MKLERRTVDIIVPVYNEAQSIELFLNTAKSALTSLNFEFQFIFINDGSTDETQTLLEALIKSYEDVSYIKLSRNFGKEAALSAGLDFATGDAVIPIDVDLQDPPEVIPLLLDKWMQGHDVVLAKRRDRSNDTFSKRASSKLFYKLSNALTQTKIPEDVGDFRLLDKRVVSEIRRLGEAGRFMKGLFAWVGFNPVIVEYDRPARSSGGSKFNAFSLTKLALDGILNFSISPLRVATYSGLLIAVVGAAYGIVIFCKTIFFGATLPGYPSLMVTILFLGGDTTTWDRPNR